MRFLTENMMRMKRQFTLLILVAFAAIGWMAMPVFADEEANAEAPGAEQMLPAEENKANPKEEPQAAEPAAEPQALPAEDAAPEPALEEQKNGELLPGAEGTWVFVGGRWRFLTKEGEYLKGGVHRVQNLNYCFDAQGNMETGWKEFDKIWFHFGKNGAQTFGWLHDGGEWYYLDADYAGRMLSDINKIIGGAHYCFKKSGAMATGWHMHAHAWHYFNASGAKVFGWLNLNGKWYYLEPVFGVMRGGQQIRINGVMYCFKSSGEMETGWVQDEDDHLWYYYDANGAGKTGWLKYGKAWYYLSPEDGSMVCDGPKEIDGKSYCFAASGEMHTGWLKDLSGEDFWYYYDADGSQASGWRNIAKRWYYFEKENRNRMVTGIVKIGGKTHVFSSDGIWLREQDAA